MAKNLSKWLDEFAEGGADVTAPENWPQTYHGSGGEQIQADWNQTDNTAKDYIKNKPEIPSEQVQADWNQTDNTAKDFIKNKPEIPAAQVQADWNQTNTEAKDFIKNKPEIPAAVSGTNDGTNWTSITIGNDTYPIPAGGETKYLHIVKLRGANVYRPGGTKLAQTFDMAIAFVNNKSAAYASNQGHTAIYDYLGVTQGTTSQFKPLLYGWVWTQMGETTVNGLTSTDSWRIDLTYVDSTSNETYYGYSTTHSLLYQHGGVAPAVTAFPPTLLFSSDGTKFKVVKMTNSVITDSDGTDITSSVTLTQTPLSCGTLGVYRLFEIQSSGYQIAFRGELAPYSTYAGDFTAYDTVIPIKQ